MPEDVGVRLFASAPVRPYSPIDATYNHYKNQYFDPITIRSMFIIEKSHFTFLNVKGFGAMT
jgi:hypothetical protein